MSQMKSFIKLDTYDFLVDNALIYAKIDNQFRQNIEEKLVRKYGSLKQYNLQRLKICYGTLKHNFRYAKYFKLSRLLKIAEDIEVSRREVFNNIAAFFAWGSNTSRELILQKELIIDRDFVEGYALYLAEGDSGFSGTTKPRKVRFTNSELTVIKHFIDWLRKYFPNNYFYLNTIFPEDKAVDELLLDDIKSYLDLAGDQIRVSNEHYNKQMKYKVCLDQAILIDLILSLERTIKKICLNDRNFATSYIRGMMTGEGTVYFNRSRYVRIEMRNESEIKYLADLFRLLGYKYMVSLRSNRENMWSIYIGAKQLDRFYREIGFGSQKKRQLILEKAVNKKLRVNQYV